MAIKYLDARRIRGTAAERAALSGNTYTAVPQTSWKYLNRAVVPANSTSTSFGTTFADKDNIMVLISWSRESGASADPKLQLGDTSVDDDDNYSRRTSANGATDFTSPDADYITKWSTGAGEDVMNYEVLQFKNITNKEKLGVSHGVFAGATGTISPPNLIESQFKWTDTSAQAGYIRYHAASGTTFSAGSEIVVLGCNDDEVDGGGTTNFWQELSSTELAEAGDEVRCPDVSGSFAAKKYLMVECHIIPTTNNSNTSIKVNGDSAQGNYSMRRLYDGGNEYNQSGTNPIGSTAGMYTGFGENREMVYFHSNIANVSGKEKVMMWDMNISNDDSYPHRVEAVGKWHTTAGQITNFKIVTSTGDHFSAGSRMRIWGGTPT